MANVTEQDIIDHLEEKIKFHQKEAKRLENLLSAFVSDGSTPRVRKAKLEAVDEAIDPLPVKQTKPVARKGKAAEQAAPEAQTASTLEIPAKYTDNLSPEAKIAFALNEIGGSGFVEDIANAMAQYEPKSDAKKISRQIAGTLTDLKEQGLIKAEKSGRKEQYSLVV
ncbi:PqqD family protein [Mucilaginibacter sp. Bleaf8]|uniref:PqqD family protein n=1 Tax=Mucilaginibacter sp. Bleaf8 TaxID=2834430 RepID=UPI001BD19E2F|nr:PqqD family protein [Mucilaginibacter sp. Bleaf8]MBS7564460.1 PqqD family protein [Mucilaginibacter sp. Bleaf8]